MKLVISIILVFLFFITVSREWYILLIMLLVFLWREQIYNFITPYWRWGYAALWGVLSLALLVSLPRYFAFSSDRVRHYYLNEDNQIKSPPIHHWLLNALLPEEELCNIGILTANIAGPLMGIANGLMNNFTTEKKRGKSGNMIKPYDLLGSQLENPLSAAYVQGLNQFMGEKNKSFYIVRPEYYDKDKAYPLVVFCHGYLGNWKLYNGVLMGLKNCIVLSIGTHDLSGIFFDDEICEIHQLYIPLLEKMGYKIQLDNITLMGLSNGGSAVNEAYRHFAKYFKNIVFISTPIHHSYPISSKVLVIGGGKDPSAPGMKSGYESIVRNNGKASIYWKEDGTHFIFAIEPDEITAFLNTELHLNP